MDNTCTQFEGEGTALTDTWDSIEVKETELKQAFGFTLAVVLSHVAQSANTEYLFFLNQNVLTQLVTAKEKGLLGENRISDVMRFAASALSSDREMQRNFLDDLGHEAVEFIENEDIGKEVILEDSEDDRGLLT